MQRCAISALSLALFLLNAVDAPAQTKGQLSYNPEKHAAFVTLRGRTDNLAAQLSVDGQENRRGFLTLFNNGVGRAHLYVNELGKGGLSLRGANGSHAVVLFVDQVTDHGALRLATTAGSVRARLRVDAGGRGELGLNAATGRRASLYIDSLNQGGLQLRGTGGQQAAGLFVSDATDAGSLRLHDAGGVGKAFAFVDGGQRGQLRLHGAPGGNRASLYVDSLDQGGLQLRGTGGHQAAMLFVGDATDSGNLRLHDASGTGKALVSVTGAGRGHIRLDGATGGSRAALYVGSADRAALVLRGGGGSVAAQLGAATTHAGYLSLRTATGATRVTLDLAGGERGRLRLNGPQGVRGQLAVDAAGRGELRLRSSGGNDAAVIHVDAATDHGVLALHRAGGQLRALLAVDQAEQGDLALAGADDAVRAQLGLDDAEEAGFIELRGQRAAQIVTAEQVTPGAPNDGAVRVFGLGRSAEGELRAELLSEPDTSGGRLVLYDAAGNPTIELDGSSGIIAKAGLNGFRIAHPTRPSAEIFYASLEGPEAGIYVRGTARLVNGRAEVPLPEHFAAVAREGTVTVQLTPHSANTLGLAVVSKAASAIAVAELRGGRGNFGFDYLVQAERADVPRLRPVRALARPAAEPPRRLVRQLETALPPLVDEPEAVDVEPPSELEMREEPTEIAMPLERSALELPADDGDADVLDELRERPEDLDLVDESETPRGEETPR
jgi:hypothetical protein